MTRRAERLGPESLGPILFRSEHDQSSIMLRKSYSSWNPGSVRCSGVFEKVPRLWRCGKGFQP